MEHSEKAGLPARRDDIARAALGVFLDCGYAGTSMAAVAKAAGIKKPSLYHHFGSKEDMFVAALSEDAAGPLREVRLLAEDTSFAPEARLRRALGLFHDAMVESPVGRLAIVISETSRQVPAVAGAFHADFIAPFHEALAAVHAPGVDAGVFRPMPARWLEHLVFSPLLHIAMSGIIFHQHPQIRAKWIFDGSREDYIAMLMMVLTDDTP